MLGGAATLTGFEADSGLPVDPPPSFRQGFGRVWLGEAGGQGGGGRGCKWLRQAASAWHEDAAPRAWGHMQLLLTSAPLPFPHPPPFGLPPPAGNSVRLANTPASPQLQVVDRVSIEQGTGPAVS